MNVVDDGDGHTRMALALYVLGGLDPSEADAVEAHLAQCASCRAESERIGPVVDLLDLLKESDADELGP
jgi:anti-sigma factor RsiW